MHAVHAATFILYPAILYTTVWLYTVQNYNFSIANFLLYTVDFIYMKVLKN